MQDTSTKSFTFARVHLALHSEKAAVYDEQDRLIDGWELALTIDNLFDETFSNPGGFEHLQDAIVQDGRKLSVLLQCRF